MQPDVWRVDSISPATIEGARSGNSGPPSNFGGGVRTAPGFFDAIAASFDFATGAHE
jgi:hypothetical protein